MDQGHNKSVRTGENQLIVSLKLLGYNLAVPIQSAYSLLEWYKTLNKQLARVLSNKNF